MKIALLGSQPQSVKLAPFDDRSWEIWVCSPANSPYGGGSLSRIDVWFDLHYYREQFRKGEDEWFAYLATQPKVYMQRVEPEIPNSVEYPIADMKAMFGPYFWTSSVAYMTALAISLKPEEIGFWGVDMAGNEEYGFQRAGCHYFIQRALEAGIKVTVPPESDIIEPSPMYGYCQANRMWRKLEARRQELFARLNASKAKRVELANMELNLHGAVQDLDYIITTFPNT